MLVEGGEEDVGVAREDEEGEEGGDVVTAGAVELDLSLSLSRSPSPCLANAKMTAKNSTIKDLMVLQTRVRSMDAHGLT